MSDENRWSSYRMNICNLHRKRKVKHERRLSVVEQRKQRMNQHQYQLNSNHHRICMQRLNEINHLIEHHLQRLLLVRQRTQEHRSLHPWKQSLRHRNNRHSNEFNHYFDQVRVGSSRKNEKQKDRLRNVVLALTSSARINRVLQAKSTVVAFGSSTPTQRIPPTVLKTTLTPGPTAPLTPATSMIKKGPSPKGKYNLRTRLFANPAYTEKDEDEVRRSFFKIRTVSLSMHNCTFFSEKISHKKTVTNTQIKRMLDIHFNHLYMCIVSYSLDRLLLLLFHLTNNSIFVLSSCTNRCCI